MLVNLALAYGSKGILYFAYHGYGCRKDNTSVYYVRGLTNPDDPCSGDVSGPRYINAYGQQKWNKVKKINLRLHNIGKHFMEFADASRQNYIYRLSNERNAMASNTFIDRLQTYPPVGIVPGTSNPDFNALEVDPDNDTYLQAAFFTKIRDTSNGNDKYFMITNRRCAPYINNSSPDNNGGRRLVTMKINPNILQGFSNWVIYDVETGNIAALFNKINSGNIYIGDFMPGEGKLFKISPTR